MSNVSGAQAQPVAAQRTSNNLTQPVTVTRRYWTELCFIKLPTIACNTSGLSLATFWNSARSEDSDAPGCFHQVQHQLFCRVHGLGFIGGHDLRLLEEACIHFVS